MEKEEAPKETPVVEPAPTPEESARIAKLTNKGILTASIFGGVLVILFVTILSIGIPALNAANAKSSTWYKSRAGAYDNSDHWISGGATFSYEKNEDATFYKLTGVNVLSENAKTLVLPSLHQESGESSLNVFQTGEGSLFADSQYYVKDVYLEGFYTYLGTNSFSESHIESISFGTTSSEKYSLEVGAKAFEDATALSKLALPSILKTIDEGAFHNVSSLPSLDLSKTSLSSLGSGSDSVGVFEGCTALSSLQLPVTLTTIGKNIFKSTPALQSITYAGKIENWNNITFASVWHDATLKSIVCSDGTITL